MATQAKMITIPDRRSSPGRGEPVIVGKFPNDQGKLEHRVVPPHKFASAGETLVFKYYPGNGVDKLQIKGKDIFERIDDYSTPGVVYATLKDPLKGGIYAYTAKCNGNIEAKGASPPIVIIDP
jgi:hypothetical protein